MAVLKIKQLHIQLSLAMNTWSIREDQIISSYVKQYHKTYTVKQMAQDLVSDLKDRSVREIEERVWVWVGEGMLF